MLSFARKYQKDIYSQNGEDGIIEEIISRIQPIFKNAAEFGSPSWYYCSNTAYLAEKGWKVTQYDIDKNADPRIIQAKITAGNVNEVVGGTSVLSIDVDGDDYNIWAAYDFKPDIVIIEINSSIQPMNYTVSQDQGASYIAMVRLGLSKGYFLLCHTGNLIFVKNEYQVLFPEVYDKHPVKDVKEYFNTSFL